MLRLLQEAELIDIEKKLLQADEKQFKVGEIVPLLLVCCLFWGV